MATSPRVVGELVPAPPADDVLDRLNGALAPLRVLTRPTVHGDQNVPEHGALLVGNHTLYGFLDLPFMIGELWTRRGVKARGLGEHGHYKIPGWSDVLERWGMVRGTRANCAELMRRGEHVLVFPGGAREVNKKRGQKYQLLWENRLGFARLAIAHGYPIVPFAAVGAEEMLDVVLDSDDPVYSMVIESVKQVTGVSLPSIVRGIGPTPIPRPQRLYFSFGEPLRTSRWSGLEADVKAQRFVRDQVKEAVESQIASLLAERERDPSRSVIPRLVRR